MKSKTDSNEFHVEYDKQDEHVAQMHSFAMSATQYAFISGLEGTIGCLGGSVNCSMGNVGCPGIELGIRGMEAGDDHSRYFFNPIKETTGRFFIDGTGSLIHMGMIFVSEACSTVGHFHTANILNGATG